MILQYSIIDPNVLALNFQNRFGCHSFNYEVIIAVWAVFITFFEILCIFPEALLAVLTRKSLVV
jgi:hypothetical protein